MGENPLTTNSLKVRFKDRTDLENFLAMAIQAITSSPENSEVSAIIIHKSTFD
jgi:hypothetical protein